MIATRFRSVAWTGCICVAALSFYMVSQTVAAKRAELAGVERKLSTVTAQIRELRTEIDTRGGLAQIENWNAKVYGLQAPSAEQFVNSSVQLVAMTQPAPQPLDPLSPPVFGQNQGAIRQASFDKIEDGTRAAATPPAPASAGPPPVTPAPERPMIRQASFVQAKPSALAPSEAPPVHQAAVHKPSALTTLGDDWLAGVTEDRSGARSRKVKP